MARPRFKWTREKYRAADTLARFLARHLDDDSWPDEAPRLLHQYRNLWDRHIQRRDPLTVPMRERDHYNRDGIPF